jgi:hypothetical protein
VRRQPHSAELAVAVPEPQPGIPVVARLMFMPVRLISKRLAPRLSTRLFQGIWGLIDGEGDPPRVEQRQASLPKLAVALALEGACTAVIGGLLDHVSRREFARLTGRWPSRTAKS